MCGNRARHGLPMSPGHVISYRQGRGLSFYHAMPVHLTFFKGRVFPGPCCDNQCWLSWIGDTVELNFPFDLLTIPNVREPVISFAEEIFCWGTWVAFQPCFSGILCRSNKNSGYRKFVETKRCKTNIMLVFITFGEYAKYERAST